MSLSWEDNEQSGRFPHKSYEEDVNKQPGSREELSATSDNM